MNGYCDCIERSSVSEIKQWVKDGTIDVDGGTETSLVVIKKKLELPVILMCMEIKLGRFFCSSLLLYS